MPRLLALPSMLAFKCLGADCDDVCCRDWAVGVSAAKRDAIARLAGAEAAAIVPAPAGAPADGHPYRIAFDAAGRCPFLAQGLCSLQVRFGADVLPETCSLFPRLMRQVDGRVELGGSLSCREVARLTLLAADGARPISLDLESGTGDRPAADDLDDLGDPRGAVLRLLADEDAALGARLQAVAVLAFGAAGEAGEAVADPPAHAAAVREIDPAPVEAVDLLRRIVATGLISDHRPAFRDVLRLWMRSYDPAGGFPPAVALRRAYLDRLAALDPRRLDAILANYARQFWFRDEGAAGPLPWRATLLFVRVALVRFFIAAHPDAERDLDGAAVDVCARLARELEHDASFARILEDHMARENLVTLRSAVLFAGF